MRDKRLCYYYDTNWSHGHKFQSPNLYLLEEVLIEREGDLSQEELPVKKEKGRNKDLNVN